MSREYIAVIKDDLNGKTIKEDDVHSIRIGWQGKWYTLDLGPDTAEEVMTVMDKYVTAGTLEGEGIHKPQAVPSRRGRPASATSTDRADKKEKLTAIREWWRAQGHEIGDRGRIPQNVVDAYEAANA